MILYLMRHGKALPAASDSERKLSEEGRSEVERISGFLGLRGIQAKTIYHSGKTRAAETARIFASRTHSGTPAQHPDLAPNDDPSILARALESWTEDAMIVGHLPHLGRLASLLLLGREDQHIVNLECATALCLERDPDGSWGLNWMVIPPLLGDIHPG
jgi:phosphohistidine phosphatase